MKLALYPKIIFRTPRFSLQEDINDRWEELKTAIAESSEDFYAVIKEVKTEDIPQLPDNIQHTIWKYFNRSRNRSTPFGTFAAVGICDLKETTANHTHLILHPDLKVHRFADWRTKDKVSYDFDELKAKNALILANSTHYTYRDHIRYITCKDGKFEIAAMLPDDFARQVLSLCSHPVTLGQVITELLPLCENRADAEERIASLIAIQLLFTSLDPNITGEDYFKRINAPQNVIDKHYIISERTCADGYYHPKNLKHLPELINLLRSHLPQPENPRLQEFIQRFRSKFDRQEVPLMAALDPEIGVGYADMEEAEGTDDLVLKLAGNKGISPAEQNPIKDMLSELLSFGLGPVRLEKVDPGKFVKPDQPLPNTFNCLFSEVDGKVFIENLGGVSATALSARFTLASKEIYKYAKDMARIEQEANPGVVFFDIAYIAETAVDNVNRRRHIYDYQLSLYNFDTSTTPLTADDIVISLQGNNLILWSKYLNKRLIPRFASAYNHSRSDLPIFRLLCDLQYQGLRTELQLRIDQLFPDLGHYPRVQYRNIILSPAKWRIQAKSIRGQDLQEFREYLSLLGTATQLRCGIADQILYFDIDREEDLGALQHYLQRRGELLVEESFVPEKSIVSDTEGKPYAAQFMATLVHHEQLYVATPPPYRSCATVRSFVPGSEWLYFEIYCHPAQMDGLLCGPICAYLRHNQSLIKKWFFIRYDEGGTHIRLRLHLTPGVDIRKLMDGLYNSLESEYISDIRIRTYTRELERYGADIMDQVEAHFCVDSRLVVALISADISIQDRYAWCLQIVQALLWSGLPGIGPASVFSATILKSLQDEHRLTTDDFARMNRKYKEYKETAQYKDFSWAVGQYVDSFLEVLSACARERRNTLLMDIFHMHVNRLFPAYQRTHELLVYYFLDKSAKSLAYRSMAMS